MGATLTTFNAVLKEIFLTPLRDALNNGTFLMNRLMKNEKDVEGEPGEAIIPLRRGRNHGVGARNEDADLPEAGAQAYVQSKVSMKYLYGRIKVSGQVMKAAKTNEGSFIRAVQSESQGLEKDFKRDINRQLFRSGTGILSICGTTTATTVVQLATTADMRWLEVGMKVDILAITTGTAITNGSDREITALDKTAKTITLGDGNGDVTTSSSHAVYREGVYNNEVMGLDGIVNDVDPDDVDASNTGVGSLQNLDVATYSSFWASQVVSNSGSSGTNSLIDPEKMQEVIDRMEVAQDVEPTVILMPHGVRAEYVKTLVPNVRFGSDLKLDGGWKGIAYSGGSNKTIPIVVDRDCYPGNVAYFLHEPDLVIYRNADFDWMDDDGAILCRRQDKDGYEATFYVYMNVGTPARNAHGRLEDITPSYTPGA